MTKQPKPKGELGWRRYRLWKRLRRVASPGQGTTE